MSETRVTARIRRTDDGEIFHEYLVDDVAYSSADAVEAELGRA